MISCEAILSNIQAVDGNAALEAQRRLDAKTKPRRSLGMLEDLACRVAAICRNADPPIPRPAVVIMAADHGVAAEGVSAYPQEVTSQMIANIASGGAASNVLARHVGAELRVVDIGSARSRHTPCAVPDGTRSVPATWLGPGTKNLVHESAMSRETAIRAIEIGIATALELIGDGFGLLALGEMGIANTTSASALTAALTGLPPEEVTGRGTGIDDAGRQHKIDVIRRALTRHSPSPKDPLNVLASLGGFEIAGLVGVMLGAASRHVPIILDGFITGAAAVVAVGLCPAVRDYCIASHTSIEPGHRVILRRLGLRPLFDLEMRLGEGTGALLAVPLVIGSLHILKDMATFTAAGVTDTGA